MGRILLVEDDDAVRSFVARALSLDGHEIVEAENGGRGLETMLADNAGFDLVLTDIMMPEMDGIEMSQNIALANPSQKILMMTGYANQRERADDVAAIVVDVVQKPFTLPVIRKQVALALAA